MPKPHPVPYYILYYTYYTYRYYILYILYTTACRYDGDALGVVVQRGLQMLLLVLGPELETREQVCVRACVRVCVCVCV